MGTVRKLTPDEINRMEHGGCTAENWENVSAAGGFDASRVRFTRFSGKVLLGDNRGFLTVGGTRRRCGIYHAHISDCRIGESVLIAGSMLIRNYRIEDEVLIEDVPILETEGGARFGNGGTVKVVNEAGGREVTLFDDLNAQVAYLQAFYRHDEPFQESLRGLIEKAVRENVPAEGRIGRGTTIRGCRSMRNVRVGPFAKLQGALELTDGSVLSCAEHPTVIGSGVILRNFIVSEGAVVDSGACMERVFVGQGVTAGGRVSVLDSLLFANCELSNSEVCSVFAGPYTVTHHASTLLIAGLFSFFNAGSGTNMSNHMYKLGPVHQGVFERGCKSGSFSYHMMECHIAPFTVVIGKHAANLNISSFPFSILTELESRSNLLPALNLYSVGTVRDGTKWPARDRRSCRNRRDLIVFDVFTPYTVERMREGRAVLQELLKKASHRDAWVRYGGVQIKRLFLNKSIRLYSMAIDRYLIGKVLDAVEETAAAGAGWDQVVRRFENPGSGAAPWLDLAGLIAPRAEVERIVEDVREGGIDTVQLLLERLGRLHTDFRGNELGYVQSAFSGEYGVAPPGASAGQLLAFVRKWQAASLALNALSQESLKGEFSESARIGYGLGQDEERRERDFVSVRGTIDENPVARRLLEEAEFIERRVRALEDLLGGTG
jgi:carbonic anhydrase/acetyltransferase-like protein (isoleucine patch superfamily)